jgi:hypothetical protein
VAYSPQIPYRARILAYCAKHGVVVPSDFDAPRSSAKFALIDTTNEPHVLFNRSTYLPSELANYIATLEGQGRLLKVLDFKRCCELVRQGADKLVRGESFDITA